MNFYIYKITNLINGKIYIGKRKTKLKIEDDFYFGSGKLIKFAIKKYGINNFTKEILEICNSNTLNEREVYWIEFLNSTDLKLGYNISNGGDGGDLLTNNPDRELIIEKRKGSTRDFSEEHKIKLSKSKMADKNPMFGNKMDDESKAHLSSIFKGKKMSDDFRKKVSKGKKGVKFTKEHKENLSKNHADFKGYKHSDESRANMSKAKKGCVLKKPHTCSNCGRKISSEYNLNKHYNKCITIKNK